MRGSSAKWGRTGSYTRLGARSMIFMGLLACKEKDYTSNDGICISLVFSLICFSSQTQRNGFICWVSFRNSNVTVGVS